MSDPLSAEHRSQIGYDEDSLGYERGTSCCPSFATLQNWARGGHADWIGELAIVEFEGELVGTGIDGECIVIPQSEIRRIPLAGGRGESRVSRVIGGVNVDSILKSTRVAAPSLIDPSNIKTRAVAGAAYKSNDIRSTLTHAVDVTTEKPLCGRVKPENLLDDPYAVDDEDAPATCPVCAKRDPRFNGVGILRETSAPSTRFRKLKLSRLASEALSNAPDSPDLSPSDYENESEIVVEKVEDRWAVVDGFHRTAGLANWAQGEKIAYESIQIRVLDVTGYDEDVIAAAAEPGSNQTEALQELYDAAI